MPNYGDSLRGYAFKTHQRDHFRCRYCGLDGTKSFANWASLSWDHLLPHGDLRRDNPDFIVTACMFCNIANNQYFRQADARNLTFENKSPDELVEQRRPNVDRTRGNYKKFRDEHVSDFVYLIWPLLRVCRYSITLERLTKEVRLMKGLASDGRSGQPLQ